MARFFARVVRLLNLVPGERILFVIELGCLSCHAQPRRHLQARAALILFTLLKLTQCTV